MARISPDRTLIRVVLKLAYMVRLAKLQAVPEEASSTRSRRRPLAHLDAPQLDESEETASSRSSTLVGGKLPYPASFGGIETQIPPE